MTIPKRIEEILEENSKKIIYLANTGQMKYKTGGTFQGLLVEAMSGSERIGYLTAEKRHDGKYVLDGVFVEEVYRKNGIATNMLRKAQNSVQMKPYITTENQIYQSEAGKKLAEKEYRMMIASTLVIAGPLAAVPELIGAGEAAAGAGEAAAGGGGALSDLGGKALKSLGKNSLLNGSGDNSQQQSTSQDSNSGVSTSYNTPANPNFTVGSKILTTVEEQLEAKIALEINAPKLAPNLLTTVPQTKPLQAPIVYPQPNSGGFGGGTTIHVNTENMQAQPPQEPQPQVQTQPKQAPKATGLINRVKTKIDNMRQRTKGTGTLQLDIAHPITDFATSATPRAGSANSSKLVSLINELSIKDAGIDKEDVIIHELMELKQDINKLIGGGEDLATVIRHDEGHDDWHRSMGQEPCTSEEDCAAKANEHKKMEHEKHTTWE